MNMKAFVFASILFFASIKINAQNNFLWTWGITINNNYNIANYYNNNYMNPWPYNSRVPVPIITTNQQWVKLTSGGGSSQSAGITSDGKLWIWVTNAPDKAPEPIQYGTDTDWREVSFSNAGRYAIKTNGTLWDIKTSTPTQMGTDNDWSKMASENNGERNIGLKTNGTIWYWTNDAAGTLDGPPAQIGSESDWSFVGAGSRICAIKTNGTLWRWNSVLTNPPVQDGTDTDWKKVLHNGESRVLGLKTDNTLWVKGNFNQYGQLGLGNTNTVSTFTQIGTDNDWADIAIGDVHNYALKSNGSLYGWGRNNYRQIGDSSTVDKSIPTKIGNDNTWLAIASGPNHGVAIRSIGYNGNSTSGTVSIYENEKLLLCNLYPIPANNLLNISNAEPGLTLYFTNTLGQTVHKEIIREVNTTINIESIPPGVYFIKFEKDNSVIGTKKIIIEK